MTKEGRGKPLHTVTSFSHRLEDEQTIWMHHGNHFHVCNNQQIQTSQRCWFQPDEVSIGYVPITGLLAILVPLQLRPARHFAIALDLRNRISVCQIQTLLRSPRCSFFFPTPSAFTVSFADYFAHSWFVLNVVSLSNYHGAYY